MPGEKTSVRVKVEGRVQGVAFRAALKDLADSIGVKGWVRNLEDGNVEALLQGERTNVDNLIKWCHVGPPKAKVLKVHVQNFPSAQIYREFQITH
jgi:acylphosphatase